MITQKRLKEILKYCSETGVFVWIKKPTKMANNISLGDEAGSKSNANGYVSIRIDKKLYKAHRLAWLYVYGEMPKKHIDHINHDRTDNRIANLREVSHQENCKNQSKPKNNTSGVVGVVYRKSRRGRKEHYEARITINGKRCHLGCFDNIEDAKEAREKALKKNKFNKRHGE